METIRAKLDFDGRRFDEFDPLIESCAFELAFPLSKIRHRFFRNLLTSRRFFNRGTVCFERFEGHPFQGKD